MIIHIDCNSFFASVEVACHPELKGRPVVVANCNEAGGGIILALTKEAKKMGLHRGDPVFKVKKILESNDVAIFPADHRKYRDASRRIMQTVRRQELVLDFLQYSIDEFFGTIPDDDPATVHQCAEQVTAEIERNCNIPVSCGCSSTYTLAKTATWFAKRYEAYDGICIITSGNIEKALKLVPIESVWGIGRRSAPKLRHYGINTARDFACLGESVVNELMNTTGVRTWQELNGTRAIDLSAPAHQQSIMHSRTFAFMETEISKLNEMLSNYAADAAANLRSDHCLCRSVTVFLCTNPHRNDLPQYSGSDTSKLQTATANTQEIVRIALDVLSRIYLKGYKYKRMGIILGGLVEDLGYQLDLFDNVNTLQNRRLMETADRLNAKFGRNTVRLTIQGNTANTTHGYMPDDDETTSLPKGHK